MTNLAAYNVCIVDDDPAIVKSLSMLLETSGCQVSSLHFTGCPHARKGWPNSVERSS